APLLDRDSVRDVGRGAPVARADGPAFAVPADLSAADVEHRLDRDDHPGLQDAAPTAGTVVRDLGLLVERRPDAVPHEVPDDPIAVGERDLLDRPPDVGDP